MKTNLLSTRSPLIAALAAMLLAGPATWLHAQGFTGYYAVNTSEKPPGEYSYPSNTADTFGNWNVLATTSQHGNADVDTSIYADGGLILYNDVAIHGNGSTTDHGSSELYVSIAIAEDSNISLHYNVVGSRIFVDDEAHFRFDILVNGLPIVSFVNEAGSGDFHYQMRAGDILAFRTHADAAYLRMPSTSHIHATIYNLQVSVIPEPATLTMLAAGVVFACVLGLRRRIKAPVDLKL